MVEELRKRWHALRRSKPGRRFQDRYRHAQSRRGTRPAAAFVARTATGGILALLGVVMLFTPGPGVLLVVVGASIVGAESLTVARRLDHAELLVRRLITAVQPRRRRNRSDTD